MRNFGTWPVYLFLVLSILTFAVAIIMSIRAKTPRIGEEKEKDFIQKWVDKKKAVIDQAPGRMTFGIYCAMLIGFPIVILAVFTFILHDVPAGIVLAVISLFLPDLIVKLYGKSQQNKYEEEYAKALRTIASNLQSGQSIQQSIRDLVDSPFIDFSMREGFRQIDSDIKIGLSVSEAFRRYANEHNSVDAKDVATAIAMQSEVGGSEAHVIEMIANNIKDRIMMRKEMKTLFADTNVMVNIMGVLPFVVVAFLYFGARDIIQPFFETTEMTILFFGLLLFSGAGTLYLRWRLRKARGGEL